MKFPHQHRGALKSIVVLAACVLPLGLHAYTPYVAPDTAFNPVNQPVGYVAQDELTDFNITSGVESLFRPEYNQQNWSGNLHAYPISKTGEVNTGAELWQGGAAQQITAQNPTSGRYIATMDNAGVGKPFVYTSGSWVTTQVASGNVTINSTSYTPAQIFAYLRGDQSLEAGGASSGQMRTRNTVLGDIIHSRPYFVDDNTNPTIFVGANDGMLHAINATTGAERWAYIPSILLPNLQKLAYSPFDTNSSYQFKHYSYVDGQVNVGYINNAAKQILVGGLGAGGQGLYALDITDMTASSDASAASKVLWEVSKNLVKKPSGVSTASSYANLGYTYGQPLLTQVQISGNSGPTDVVIVGNGLNPSETSGAAYLYVIDANTGAQIAEIRAAGTGTGVNGIFNPVGVSTNNSGVVDRVYAGDLNGTLWRFDLSSSVAPVNWPATAVFITNPAQPITGTPGIAVHPNGGYMVNFGTGSALFGAYGTYNHTTGAWTTNGTGEMDTTIQSSPQKPPYYYVYGIWDGAPASNSTLLSQTLEERIYVNNNVSPATTTRVRRGTANVPNWASGGHKGWQVQLPIPGERVIGEGSFIESGRFYFNAYNPTVPPTLISGTNTDIYGENWLMELNYLTGGSSYPAFMDMNGADSNGNVAIDIFDLIVYTSADQTNNLIPAGSKVGDPIVTPSEKGIPIGKMVSTGVQSQPLLVQLQTLNTTLLNQNPDVIYPATTTTARGVAGGHFDVDFFNNPNLLCSNLNGSAQKASGTVTFNVTPPKVNGKTPTSFTVTSLTITVDGNQMVLPALTGSTYTNTTLAQALVTGQYSTLYTITSSNKGTITISANNPGSAGNVSVAVNLSVAGVVNPSVTVNNLTGGSDTAPASASSNTTCGMTVHTHEYDKTYDKTGINMLNPSVSSYQLVNAIPNSNTPFKVLLMNQYLNPAIRINLANKTDTKYNPSTWDGYVSVANFQTSGLVDPATLPSYTMSTIGSLVINMPVDGFSQMNWWGGTGDKVDVRVGVMPTSPACVNSGTAVWNSRTPAADVNAPLYNPVIPPTTVTADGNGTIGTSTGVRHNGAITVQIITADTTAADVEFNDPGGNPAYGTRVKASSYFQKVIAEYVLFWHHPSRVCYGDTTHTWYNATQGTSYGYYSLSTAAWNTTALMTGTGWTKLANADTIVSATNTTPASGSKDPKIGTFGNTGSGGAANITTTTAGNVTTTTIKYADGSVTVIVTTINANGSATVVTTNTSSGGVATTSSSTVAASGGTVKSGGDESGNTSKTRRISWRELVKP